MSNFFVLGFVTLFAVINAYDFQDELFNQIIKQDLDDFEQLDIDQFTTVRRRRDATTSTAATTTATDRCKKRRWRMCCGDDIIDAMMEKDRDLKKECFKEITNANKDDKPAGSYDPFSCEKINKTKKEFICVMECLGRKKNISDKDGNIKAAEFLESYKQNFGKEQWFYALIEQAVPKCLQQVKNATFVKDKSDPLSCNPGPLKMHHCMWREIQLSCPDDKISDNRSCTKIREKIKKHDFVPFRHHHHHDSHDDE